MTDTDLTLPSVVASLSAMYAAEEVVLSIVFHPDTSRIGDWVVVPQRNLERHPAERPWVLGRSRPAFGGGRGDCASPLDDPHISRHALQFALVGKQLVIRRPAGASRCRVGGRELSATVELDELRLRAGVPILLGHSVVLLLRLVSLCPPAAPGDRDPLLRGSSASMERVRRVAAQAAGTDLDVLVLGETGTGKELVATTIYAGSARAHLPLVSVNMAAIPPELAAAALFGSARGAFTGATRTGVGYFEQAQGGTLFLDEIGDTPPDVQPLLLRALQQREIQAVGGAVRRVDVRVISATDADLNGDGCDFKAALRHRLAVCEIQLPPLRERPEDIGELFWHFLGEAARELGREAVLPNADSPALSIAVWADLFHRSLAYHWPGNVRELLNVSRQVLLASEGALMLPEHLVGVLNGSGRPPRRDGDPPPRQMREISAQEFARVLQANQFAVSATARQLRVSRQAVYRRIEESETYLLASQIAPGDLRRALAQYSGDSVAAARQLRVSLAGLRARLRASDLEWH